jgi:glutathione peroxidase
MADDAYQFVFTALDGSALPLSRFAGKAMLIVNTASQCGYTPQYKDLEALWKARHDQGLAVIGVPCNQFGRQEPGSEAEIAQFCEVNYGVTFPLTSKCDVKGKSAHPFYRWAAGKAGAEGEPQWNFHKYLIGRDGRFAGWFSSQTKPLGPKIAKALEPVLGS